MDILDEVDRKLIAELLKDSRTSQRKLAKAVGVALGTVSSRLKSLESRGVLREYTISLDSKQVGWDMTVIAGLRIKKGLMIDVQNVIAADSRVFAVYDVTGDYDSIVMARVEDRTDLNNLTKEVFSIEGVIRSFTHVVLNTVKETGVIPPFLDYKNE